MIVISCPIHMNKGLYLAQCFLNFKFKNLPHTLKPTVDLEVKPTSTYLNPSMQTKFSQSHVSVPNLVVVTLKHNVSEVITYSMLVVCEVACSYERMNMLAPCRVRALHKPSPFLFKATCALLYAYFQPRMQFVKSIQSVIVNILKDIMHGILVYELCIDPCLGTLGVEYVLKQLFVCVKYGL